MQNNGILKRISIFLILVLAITFALPSKEVMAIGEYLDKNEKNSIYVKKQNFKSNNQIQLFSSTIYDNLNKIKICLEKKDIKILKEVVKETLSFIDTSKDLLINELEQELPNLEELDLSVAENRFLDFKNYIEKNFLNIEKKFKELKSITESLDNGSNLNEVERKINELSTLIDIDKPEQSIGSNLPHRNIHIEPSAPSIGEQMVLPSRLGTKSEPVLNFSKIPTSEDLKETSEVKFTEEIMKLADSLNSVVEIYEYVKNNINFETYYGSRKGSLGTLQQMAGNDFDQASLLIALLRYKGIPARYVRGTIEIPSEDVMRWVGAETPEAAVKTLGSLGKPTVSVVSSGTISHIRTEHVWVEAFVAYDSYRGVGDMKGQKIWVPLDPSFKRYERIDGLDFGDLLDIDTGIGFDAINENANFPFLITTSRVNNDDITEKIAQAEDKIEEYIKQEGLENASREDIFGGNKIIPENIGLLPLSLPYNVVTIIDKTSIVPDEFRESVSFSIRGAAPFDLNFTGRSDFNFKANTADLYGKRITLSWAPASIEDEKIIKHYGGIFNTPAYLLKMKPQLKVDGQIVAEGKEVGLGYRQEFKITMKSAGISEEEIVNPVTVGGFYCIGFDYGIVSPDELKKIAGNIDQLKNTINIDNIYTDEAMGEILNAVAKSYFIQLNMYDLILKNQFDVNSNKLLSEAMTGYDVKVDYMFMSPVKVNENGMFIDVDRNSQSVVSTKGAKNAETSYMLLSGMIGSTMEHAIFEQFTGIPSVSTIKVLQEANDRGIPLHAITKDNMDEVLPLLEVKQTVKNDIRNSINAGRMVIIPERDIQYYDWSGSGYIVIDLETGSAGYMISGGIAGGAMSVGQVLTEFVTYVINGLIAMVIYHLIETAILLLVPAGWALGVYKILQIARIVIAAIALISFAINAIMMVDLYFETGDVYYLQELLIQIAAISTLLALNLGPLKGLNQKIEALKGEIVAIKTIVSQLQSIGVPAKVTNDFIKTYGIARINQAAEVIGYFKNYGLSENALATIGRSFDADGIALIQTTYMKSAVIYSGSDTDMILILFKQAGNISNATGLSNSIITLSNSGILPSMYGEYGIIPSVSGLLPTVNAINSGITSTQIKTLFDIGIKPSEYDDYGIIGRESAEKVAKAIQNIKRIMNSADVTDLVNYTKKITVYDDYAEFVTKDGVLFKITRSEVPEGDFSKLDKLIYKVEEIDEIAKAAYDSIRNRGLDINAIRTISANTGLSESEVTILIRHVFLNKHLIPQPGGILVKYTYFTPDPEIAYAIKCAEQGPLTQQGKDWFRQYATHELEEYEYELEGHPYRTLESWDPIYEMYTGNPPGAHDMATPFQPSDYFPGYTPGY